MPFTIRRATTADGPALAALERASPERGPFTIRIEPQVNHFALAARHPGARGYVALASDGVAIVGMLFASIAPTQLNGEIVSAVYLFALRVHPAYRRRGIATALLEHATEEARSEANCQVAWGAVVAGNEPSRRTVRRAGFGQSRRLSARVVFPSLASAGRMPDVRYRTATADDLPTVAAALNARYGGHQFWRPLTGDQLEADLSALHGGAEKLFLAEAQDADLLGAASGVALHKLARLRVVGFSAAPSAVNAVLRPLLARLPLRPVLVRRLLAPGRPTLVLELLRRLSGDWPYRFWTPVVVPLDPLDPGWSLVARLPGFTVHFFLVARSPRTVAQDRPWSFD